MVFIYVKTRIVLMQLLVLEQACGRPTWYVTGHFMHAGSMLVTPDVKGQHAAFLAKIMTHSSLFLEVCHDKDISIYISKRANFFNLNQMICSIGQTTCIK